MLIAEINYQTGSLFDGECRIISSEYRETGAGKPYLAMRIGDMSGAIPVYAWLEKHAKFPEAIKSMDSVRLHGKLRNFNNRWMADVLDVEILSLPYSDPVKLIPGEQCPLPDGLDALRSVLESLTIPELRNFARNVLSKDALAIPFVNAPASLQHHHNQPGGLLEHSIECADIVGGMTWFPDHVRELGVVAALFHDVAKTITLSGEMKRTTAGYLLDHDSLTLQELSNPLGVLDIEWPDGGRALRYILSWDKGRFHQSAPLMPIAEAVRFADHTSTGINMEEKLYQGLPAWQQFVKSDVGAKFWRPRCPVSQLGREENAVNDM